MSIQPILLLSCIALLLVSNESVAQAKTETKTYSSTAEIALSDQTLELGYMDTGDHFGMEKSQLRGAFFLSEDRDILLSAGLQFPANFDLGPVTLTFGPQLYAALLNDENSDIMAVSIGTEVRFDLIPSYGVAVTGHAYYAPDVLTFGSADKLTDFSARLEADLADRLTIFGGYRWLRFDLTEGAGEQTLQDGFFAGFGYRF